MIEPKDVMFEIMDNHATSAMANEVRVVKIDVARMSNEQSRHAKLDGNWLIIEASKFAAWITEQIEYMEPDEDAYLIQTGTMTREELDNLPEHDGW